MKKYITIFAALVSGTLLSAQNLNQSVEVTNTYEGKIIEVDKQELKLTVPDSLTNFDYHFDYSVFDKPFQGSYEFHPYLMSMKPEPKHYSGNSFYFRAGAGYQFKPEAQFSYSPTRSGRLRFSVYDFFSGFSGDMLKMQTVEPLVNRYPFQRAAGGVFAQDISNSLGINFKYDGKKSSFIADISYNLLAVKDSSLWKSHPGRMSSSSNNFAVKLDFRHKETDGIYYGVTADFGYTYDRIFYRPNSFALSEVLGDVKMMLGMNMDNLGDIVIRSGINVASYSMTLSAFQVNPYVIPSYEKTFGPFSIHAGARISFLFGKDKGISSGMSTYEMFTKKSNLFYPDVKMSLNMFKNHLQLSASLRGYDYINTFSSLQERQPFFDPVHTKTFTAVMDNTVVPVDAEVALRGSIADHIQFEASGSYRQYQNYAFEAAYILGMGEGHMASPYFEYYDLNLLLAKGSISWTSNHFNVAGTFQYAKPKLDLDNFIGLGNAIYSGGASFSFDIAGRMFFGASCNYNSGRNGRCRVVAEYLDYEYSPELVSIPSYIDLSANAEFKYSKNFSIWLKGENLLGQTVPVYTLKSYKGVIFTAGICLSL